MRSASWLVSEWPNLLAGGIDSRKEIDLWLLQTCSFHFWRNRVNYEEAIPIISMKVILFLINDSKSKVGDLFRGWREGSLFNSYYTEV